jgi:hypothetical protein
MVDPLELVTQKVAQHRLAMARLHGEIGAALDMALAQWYPTHPDPMQIQGGTLCSDVRTHVLAMNGINARSVHDPGGPRAPQGASCGPGSTLRMSTGPSSSVRFGDTTLAWGRVRHISPERAEEIGAISPQPMPKSRPGKQMSLDAGEPEDQRVFGPAGIGDDYELIVYWWETPGRLSVGGAILAAVADLDTGEERPLAFAPLPPAIRPKTKAEQRIAIEDDDEDLREREDFGSFLPKKDSESEESDTGNAGA